MIEVIVVGEGQTEETFVRDVLVPHFASGGIYLYPRLMPTSRYGRGGALKKDRTLKFLRNTLRERQDVYVTTLFDLYGLDEDFPGKKEAAPLPDPLARASLIEASFGQAVLEDAQCRADRFLPHIQPYEFEALLFSDTDRLVEIDPGWKGAAEPLRTARSAADSPEHIDDGADTHPSARLRALLRRPPFDKVLHGTSAAARIGLTRIRAECAHFGDWLARIEGLQPL